MSSRILALICLIGAFWLAVSAGADVTLVMEERNDGVSTISVRGNRVSISRGDDAAASILYHGDTRTLYAIDHANKLYTALDPQAMQRMGDAMNSAMGDAMKQMQARMAALPPEQREAMLAHMPPAARRQLLGGAGEAAPVEVVKTGPSAKINGFACEYYQVKRGGVASERTCLATPKALGLGAADFGTLADLFALFSETAKRMPGGPAHALPGLRELGRIPVRTENAAGGETTSLQSVRQEALAPARFELPAGYQRQAIPGAP